MGVWYYRCSCRSESYKVCAVAVGVNSTTNGTDDAIRVDLQLIIADGNTHDLILHIPRSISTGAAVIVGHFARRRKGERFGLSIVRRLRQLESADTDDFIAVLRDKRRINLIKDVVQGNIQTVGLSGLDLINLLSPAGILNRRHTADVYLHVAGITDETDSTSRGITTITCGDSYDDVFVKCRIRAHITDIAAVRRRRDREIVGKIRRVGTVRPFRGPVNTQFLGG